jgi:hypothetical protein
VKIAVSLLRYTDYATETVVDELPSGEQKVIPVNLTLNDKVIELSENTPVQADIRLSYFEDGAEKKVSLNSPILLYSRNAISWSDKSRIASFVTPRDVPIAEFSRNAIRSFLVMLKGSTVGKPLAKAVLFYESLNALGISYVPDPKTPFTDVSGKPEILDYVQLPRETLRRKTGDCDDTTALLSSMLESVGVQTALVDTPGHIFLMANLEENDLTAIGLSEDRFVLHDGSYWVPIETTQLGKNFFSAWQMALSEVKAAQEKGTAEFVLISNAHQSYPPVTIIEEEKEQTPYPEEKVNQTFPPVLLKLQQEKYEGQINRIKEEIKANPIDHMLLIQMGMIHVEGGKPEEGKKLFESLLKEDEPLEVQAAAKNNLGNISYINGKYDEAAKLYAEARTISQEDGGILINQARAAWRLNDQESAKKYLQEAKEKVKEWREYSSDIPVELYPK